MAEILNWIIKIFDVSGGRTSAKLHQNIKKVNSWFKQDKINIWKDFNKSIKKLWQKTIK